MFTISRVQIDPCIGTCRGRQRSCNFSIIMEENLRRLSTCLNQASQMVTELAGNRRGNSVGTSFDETTTNTAMASVGQAVTRARSMMQQSTARGAFRRLNGRERLRASTSTNSAPVSSKRSKLDTEKVFEFVLVRVDDSHIDDIDVDKPDTPDSWMLTEESVVVRGFITLNSGASEQVVRKALCDAIQLKYPAVASQDLVFLKANRRKLTQPVNCQEYSYKQLKLLAGQGAIYIKLRTGYNFLLDNQNTDNGSMEDSGESYENDERRPVATPEPRRIPVPTTEPTRPVPTFESTGPVSISEPARPVSAFEPRRPLPTNEATGPVSAFEPTGPLPTTEPTGPVFASEPLESQQTNNVGDVNKTLADSIPDLETAAEECVNTCKTHNVSNPVEILKCAQNYIVQGRPLDVTSLAQALDGETNFVCIDRFNVLESAVEELKAVDNFRLTLEVSFYGEKAHDSGGPRKEFFRLSLKEIKDKYFDNRLRELVAEEYEYVGVIMALSILQNGPVPRFMPEEILQEVFSETPARPCLAALRRGFMKLGLYQIAINLPLFLHLMHPNEANQLSRKKLILFLKPSFSEEGSNARKYENDVYAFFAKYVRETASGRRGAITLGSILQFATGLDEEPPLGFELEPCIQFLPAATRSKWSFIPTANTCSATMVLPRGSNNHALPNEGDLFELYDTAFTNTYFGLV